MTYRDVSRLVHSLGNLAKRISEKAIMREKVNSDLKSSGRTSTGRQKSVVASTEPDDRGRSEHRSASHEQRARRSPAPSPPSPEERKQHQEKSKKQEDAKPKTTSSGS